jgi:hypothetical protein
MSIKTFRRYTNLASTIHMLRTQTITLLNPATWDDKNDAYYMAEYKRLKRAETVLALCFTESPETYHHWRVFSHGADGACIEFDKPLLLKAWKTDPDILTKSVAYRELQQLRAQRSIRLEELPFLKRFPYRDEKEFRVIFVGMDKAEEAKSYAIDLACIRRITLSPWMPKALVTSVKETLRLLPECTDIKIYRSTLTDNEAWKGLTARAVDKAP